MTKLTARVASALLLCVWSAGCSQAFREPEILIDAAALAGGLNSQHFELDLNIYNPNHYRLDASQIHYNLIVDSTAVASGLIERRITLKPRDSSTVRAPVDVEMRAVGPMLLRFVFRGGELPFQLTGEMRIETIFGGVTRSFDQRGTYDPIRGRVTIFKRN